jgi:hypothetical protein
MLLKNKNHTRVNRVRDADNEGFLVTERRAFPQEGIG